MLAVLALGRQVGKTCVTLEARMCPAQAVFEGVVVDDRWEALPPLPGAQPDRPVPWPEGFGRETLTIRVGEVWKGRPGNTVTLVREGPGATDLAFKAWIGRRTPAVWFVQEPNRWSILCLDASDAKDFGAEAGYGLLPVLSMRLDVLRTPDEVRKALREFAPRARENPEVEMYPVGPSLPRRVGLWADAYGLKLPLVPEMVPTALALIENPLGVLSRRALRKLTPPTDAEAAKEAIETDRLREIGADLLRRFKTPENVARLRVLLDDRTVQTTKDGKRVYPVRKTASEILRAWGVDVPAQDYPRRPEVEN